MSSDDYVDRGYPRLVAILEESIDIVDRLESFIARISPEKGYEPGLVFQFYQNLVVLRERLVEARMRALEDCHCR